MENLRLEASPRSAVAAFSPCICTVCGLVLSTQLPLFAAEPTPTILRPTAPATVRSTTVTKQDDNAQNLRPMAFRRTTAAPSAAKSQLSKTRSTPLQTLKPTAMPKTTRFALTAPARARNDFPEQNWATPPEERIVMTALPTHDTSSDAPTVGIETGKSSAPVRTQQTPTKDILDTVARNALARQTALEVVSAETDANVITDVNAVGSDVANNGESEPLTGTITLNDTINKKPVESAPTETVVPPAAPVATEETANVSDVDIVDTTSVVTADSKTAQTSRLFAPSITYEGGTIIAEGTPENPVRLEGTGTRIIAQKVRLDTINKSVSAQGTVRVERQVTSKRFSTFNSESSGGKAKAQMVTETLQGENFEYNYETRQGKLGATRIRLANFNISAEEIIINGTKYSARNVVIRPGGLSDEEIKIYGTPPFSIRAKSFEADTSKPAPSNKSASDTADDVSVNESVTARTQVRGAGLYFKKFRILPIPSALLGRSLGGPREEETYQLTPRIGFNSADGLLVTVGLKFPLSALNSDRLTLKTDIGISTKVGFRGGIALETSNKLGKFTLGARLNDVISSQLTNRIELDRLPELTYEAPQIGLFALPGGRRAGVKFELSAGDYRERFTTGDRATASSRLQGQVRFTTRAGKKTGPYLDLTGRSARYSRDANTLSTLGYEIGYAGSVGSRISGRFSYGSTKVNGTTPFEFDRVAIREELRATFDILLTPRYIIPIDLRYDLDRGKLRERTFGILRNYNTFAYGLTYQSSRQELQFQVRQGF